jgi:hypothetical protein
MLFMKIVCNSSEDLTKYKYTIWTELEFVQLWQAVLIVKETQRYECRIEW